MHKNNFSKIPTWFNYLFGVFSIFILILFLYTSWVTNTGAETSAVVKGPHLVLDKQITASQPLENEPVSSDG